MNQRGLTYIGFIGFIASLFILGLYVSIGEPILTGMLSGSTVAGPGTDAYIIILAAPFVILLAGFWLLFQSSGNPIGG